MTLIIYYFCKMFKQIVSILPHFQVLNKLEFFIDKNTMLKSKPS